MRYYQEVTLLPSPEISLAYLWQKVYTQIHLGLVSQKDENDRIMIGVSFPEYLPPTEIRDKQEKWGMGSKLRLFANDEIFLKNLNAGKLFARLNEYVHVTSIRPVPNRIKGYSVYQRIHQKNSIQHDVRRYARRHSLSYEEAEKLVANPKYIDIYPYIQMKSLTNNHRFLLLVKKENREKSSLGCFGTYGLSSTATVPEF